MLPTAFINNPANSSLGYIKFFSQFFYAFVVLCFQRYYFFNFRFFEFSFTCLISPCISSFFKCIGIIILTSSYENMTGIDTRSIIAMMTNTHILWYLALKMFPRKSMGFNIFSAFIKHPIPVCIFFSSPIPAISSFFNMPVKDCFFGQGSRFIGTGATT
jgi:hypothetical protein